MTSPPQIADGLEHHPLHALFDRSSAVEKAAPQNNVLPACRRKTVKEEKAIMSGNPGTQ
jgi:hypothetical protein